MKNRRNIVELKYPPENPNDIWLKDGKFYRSTSEGWVVIDSKTEYTSKESMIADKPEGGAIGIDKETGETSIYNDVAEQWSPLSGGGVTSITWLELKDKRDAGKLIPGALYRITDYQCTTTQENTKSAGHQFDIVLLALSKDKLAEEGWAMMHENDTYFANSNLSAWKVWYCLDNDKSRFAWARDIEQLIDVDSKYSNGVALKRCSTFDGQQSYHPDYHYAWGCQEDIDDGDTMDFLYSKTESLKAGDELYYPNDDNFVVTNIGSVTGKGVIYRLIDEWNNDCPFDFKNIMFKVKITDGLYAKNGTDTFCYCFNLWHNSVCEDASTIGNVFTTEEFDVVDGVHNNKVGCYISNNIRQLPLIGIFTNITEFGYDGLSELNIGNNCMKIYFNNPLGVITVGSQSGGVTGWGPNNNIFVEKATNVAFSSNVYNVKLLGVTVNKNIGSSGQNKIYFNGSQLAIQS